MPKLLAIALLLLLSTACRPAAPELGPPPNVLLLVIDCLRADHLGVAGYERPTTPNIDALAAEGIRFTRAVSQASWTRPSLPTILTGLYPSEHGLHNYDESEPGKVKSPSLAESVDTVSELLKARGYRTALIGEQFQLSPRFGLNQGFDFYKNRASDAANIHRNFFRWLERPGESGQFFAYLHYLEIHWPYCPPPHVRGKFNTFGSEIRWCRKWRELRSDILSGAVALTEADREALRARYDEELLALDGRLGELFARLREDDLWDETLIVVTSDHGEEFYEHGSMGHGQSLHRELIDVPLIFKPPAAWKSPAGGTVDAVVELRSLSPTVLQAAGAPPLPGISAPSLVPWMAGRTPREPPATFVVAENRDEVVVRTEGWKLIAQRDGQGFELYDLSSDPGEMVDVTHENRAKLKQLRDFLETWEQGLRPTVQTESRELDAETVEGLKALGYID